jgi:lipoprotein-anchoring transpeptidase ErfK/SrfK
MRLWPIVASGLGVALVGTGSAVTVMASDRQASFAHHAAALEQRWGTEITAGEPAASLEPLRSQLAASPYSKSPAWSPEWWFGTGQSLLDSLDTRTTSAWTAALTNARSQAASVFTSWAQLSAQLSTYIPASWVAAELQWNEQLAAAATPIAVEQLISRWTGDITAVHTVALMNQLNAEVAVYGGLNGLIAQANSAVTKARHDKLDPGQVPALTTTLQTEVATHVDATTTIRALVGAVQALHALLGLNHNVAAGLPPLLYSVDQAAAESTPGAAAFLARYNTLSSSFRAARETSQLNAIAVQIVALQTSVAAALGADQCGHAVPSGKAITLNLTLQEAIFYDNGCVVRATPITTGRPYLRTPTGDFHVFYKASPFTMVSPWPKGSPFWYPTGTVTWVMEFDVGGYFLHDASWEPNSMFGPGSENTSIASHGCVHIPTPVMRWAYSWTPIGTPVIITQ